MGCVPFFKYRGEFTGAFGDIGTFLPIALASVSINGLNPQPLFLLAGCFYITSGAIFRVPMSVQPLKALAAVAIANGLDYKVISAAALIIGIALLLFLVFRLERFLAKVFTVPIIRGIQTAVGLLLIKSAIKLIFAWPTNMPHLQFHHTSLFPGLPSLASFKVALWLLVIPQLPLTLANAVVATEDAAKLYYGPAAHRVTYRRLTLSMGLANLFVGLFNGLPLCHGSSGVTAHYRFGARRPLANMIIGTSFILLGLILYGDVAHRAVNLLPPFILGLMLLYVGLHHARLIFLLKGRAKLFVATCVFVPAFIFSNLALGALLGLVVDRFRIANKF